MKYEIVTLLTPKIRFPMLMLFPMSYADAVSNVSFTTHETELDYY